jgi:hypothetical protein
VNRANIILSVEVVDVEATIAEALLVVALPKLD